MPLKRLLKLRRTLIFRLTILYTLSIIVFLGAFIGYRIHRDSIHYSNVDKGLVNDAKSLSALLDSMKGIDAENLSKTLNHESENSRKLFIRLISSNGKILASSDISDLHMDLSSITKNPLRSKIGYNFKTLPLSNEPYTARVISYSTGPDDILQIGVSQKGLQQIIEKRWREFGMMMGLLILFSTFVGWFVAKCALVGVEEITNTATRISDGDFSSRVPIKGRGEEIDRLAITFNNMIEKIQSLIKGMKEITDNMAHDLRSPITRIRCAAEMTITSAKNNRDYGLMAGNIVEECDRLLDIINMMMDISEADAGLSKLNISQIDISQIADETCELFQPVAEDKNIRIIKKLSQNSLINADKQKLQRVVSNLFDNAIKYTSDLGTISLISLKDSIAATAVGLFRVTDWV